MFRNEALARTYERLLDSAGGHRDRDSGIDAAIMAFAGKVARDAASVTRDDIDHLRELGLADEEIVDVVLAAAARGFFSTVLDALGAEPDSVYNELEPTLLEALTVGRPLTPAP